jgi:hypothetical protein
VCEVRLPLVCWWLSTLSAKFQFGLFAFTSKPRLCHVYLDWWFLLMLPLVFLAVQILLILLNEFLVTS